MQRRCMMKKRIIILEMFLVMIFTLCSCDKKEKSDNTERNYITNAVAPEIYEIMYEGSPDDYEVRYRVENNLIDIDGVQEVVSYERFYIYEKDENGNFISCKSIMVTKPNSNHKHMEQYIKDVYGENFEYLKPYENVYVIEQEMPLSSK